MFVMSLYNFFLDPQLLELLIMSYIFECTCLETDYGRRDWHFYVFCSGKIKNPCVCIVYVPYTCKNLENVRSCSALLLIFDIFL